MKTAARQSLITAAALLGAVVADLVFAPAQAHGEAWWSHIPGFFALFGLVVCLAFVFLGKGLVKIGLQRKESYYDDRVRSD